MSPHLYFLLVVVYLPGDMDMHGAPLPWFLHVQDKNMVSPLYSLTRTAVRPLLPPICILKGSFCGEVFSTLAKGGAISLLFKVNIFIII